MKKREKSISPTRRNKQHTLTTMTLFGQLLLFHAYNDWSWSESFYINVPYKNLSKPLTQKYTIIFGHCSINPFAPEPPVTSRADPGPFYPLWRHQF